MIKMKSIQRSSVLVFAITVFASQARGQVQSNTGAIPSIEATGEAVVHVKPDSAEIDVGVVSQAQKAEVAANENAKQLTTVLGDLKRVLGPRAEIETISYSLHPNYRYPKEGGTPEVVGYTANNVVRVRLGDLTLAGKVVDTATQSGANRIQRLQFRLKNERIPRARALQDAAISARSQAEAMASALGVRIKRVLSVKENAVVSRSFEPQLMARTDTAVSTPVEPGTIEIRASVTLTLEIADR